MTTDTKALRELLGGRLIDTLECQKQLDEDGIQVGVCREALHYAIVFLNEAPALLDELDKLRAENERLREAINAKELLELEACQDADELRAALRIIAGEQQCIDHLLSNVEIARAALEGKP